MAGVRSLLLLLLLVTLLELTDCQLFYLLTYLFYFLRLSIWLNVTLSNLNA